MRDEVHPEFRHKHFHNDSEKSNDSSIQSKFQKIHTEWSKVYIGALLLFFINLEKNVLALSDWLYMKQLDPTVSPDFFGAVLGVARIGHAVATIAFSYWRSKTKTTK
ncbi:unnamed protein product, partial [Mesorhabditis belari]|uniref:Uncharacterized protein n=1 Tax=Mesorhabditis belari TaxID=2138241 RepID=A0AAF3FJ62_9BILA